LGQLGKAYSLKEKDGELYNPLSQIMKMTQKKNYDSGEDEDDYFE
jgi:hypothetical protein